MKSGLVHAHDTGHNMSGRVRSRPGLPITGASEATLFCELREYQRRLLSPLRRSAMATEADPASRQGTNPQGVSEGDG